jgi:hypothetical protein
MTSFVTLSVKVLIRSFTERKEREMDQESSMMLPWKASGHAGRVFTSMTVRLDCRTRELDGDMLVDMCIGDGEVLGGWQ